MSDMLFRKQQGAVLVVALSVLLVLTLVGVFSLQSTAVDERMTENLQDLNFSLQATESTLREAESVVEGLANTSGFGTRGGFYSFGHAPDPFVDDTWSGASANISMLDLGMDNPPRYFIELIGEFSDSVATEFNVLSYGQENAGAVTVFRIVARGTGTADTAPVVLESYYGRRF